MELRIVWSTYPAHCSTEILQRPVDVVNAHPEYLAKPRPIGELLLERYGVTCNAN